MPYDTVLVVDDERFNLDILNTYLTKAGYKTSLAENGLEAWSLLRDNPEEYSVILLDRMMPQMDGLELVDKMKNHETLKHLPVIMQSAAAQPHQVAEGLNRGVYYYVTKPFKKEMILSVVNSAEKEYRKFLDIRRKMQDYKSSLHLLEYARFKFKTIEQGENLAAMLGTISKKAHDAAFGLSELFLNAIEHGNLEISYEDKKRLVNSNTLMEEINRRQKSTKYKHREVEVIYQKKTNGSQDSIFSEVVIKDEGNGFDWEKYLEFGSERMFDPNGRGILMAKSVFNEVEYYDGGRSVKVQL